MSTSKYINKICIVAVIIILAIVVGLLYFGYLQPEKTETTMEYEGTLFDNSYVHTINIVMDDWDGFIENCESEEYSACDIEVDGELCQSVAIRAKGNTSLSSVKQKGSQRYSLKLEFDHYVNGKSLDGLDKLCLNNLIQDNTMMKDYIAYQMMEDFGVDAPLSSFVYVTVNGEDWGLFLAVEGIEDSFLNRNYGNDAGELYKPDSMGFGGGRGNGKDFDIGDFDFGDISDEKGEFQRPEKGDFSPDNMPQGGDFNPEDMPPGGDFNPQNMPQKGNSDSEDTADGDSTEKSTDSSKRSKQGGFGGMGSDDVKLKYIDDDPDSYSNIFNNSKNDVSSKDKKRLISSLKKLSSYSDLENIVDIDEVLRYFVVHTFLVNGDSYTGSMIHNYYLREKDGIMSMIPWDYNLAFGTFQGRDGSSQVNSSIDNPVSNGTVDDRPMFGWIFSDQKYTDAYHELYSEFVNKWFTNGEMEKFIDETAELIRPYVEKDPTKFCTTEAFEAGINTIKQFVALRGEAVSRQLAGDTIEVDTGDLDVSKMGSMGGENRVKSAANANGEDSDKLDISNIPDKNGEKPDISGGPPSGGNQTSASSKSQNASSTGNGQTGTQPSQAPASNGGLGGAQTSQLTGSTSGQVSTEPAQLPSSTDEQGGGQPPQDHPVSTDAQGSTQPPQAPASADDHSSEPSTQAPASSDNQSSEQSNQIASNPDSGQSSSSTSQGSSRPSKDDFKPSEGGFSKNGSAKPPDMSENDVSETEVTPADSDGKVQPTDSQNIEDKSSERGDRPDFRGMSNGSNKTTWLLLAAMVAILIAGLAFVIIRKIK